MFAITRSASPFVADGSTLQGRFNRLVDEAFRGWPQVTQDDGGSLAGQWVPPVDVFEDKDAVQITAELPGVKPEDVKISLENNVLTVRGEKRQTSEENTDRVHRYERCYGCSSAPSRSPRPWTPTTSRRATISACSRSGCPRSSGPSRGRSR